MSAPLADPSQPVPPPPAPKRSRIQEKNRQTILAAALEVYSTQGYAGATLEQISQRAGLSKPNLLYYFASKEAIYDHLLHGLLAAWLAPLRDLRADGEPLAEIRAYLHRKIELARDFPRESRLFAHEILQGAPRLHAVLAGPLKGLVDEKAALIGAWMAEGRLRAADPLHLILSIWALSQHYADFEAQTRVMLGPDRSAFPEAARFLDTLYLRLLQPVAEEEAPPAPRFAPRLAPQTD